MLTQFESWKRDVYDKADEIDPSHEEHLWKSLALGYFIGLGLSIEHAEESVRIVDKEGLL